MIAQEELAVVDGTAPDWVAQVEERVQSGHNFFLRLRNHPDAIKHFCETFELGADCEPAVLTRSALISLSLFMDNKDFDFLLDAQRNGDKVVFIEQLDLALNRPPRVKPYLVYCPTWGIVSQHEELHPAREAYYDYLNSLVGLRPHSEAGIYKWTGTKWQLLMFR